MTLTEYMDKVVRVTARYPDHGKGNITYTALALNGEAGEVAEKVKKILRDKKGVVSPEDKEELIKELGDCLWNCGAMAMELGTDLQEVLDKNVEKLMSRQERNKISGSGDNR